MLGRLIESFRAVCDATPPGLDRARVLAAIAAITDLERSAVCPIDLGEIRAMLDERIARLRDATEGTLFNRRLLP